MGSKTKRTSGRDHGKSKSSAATQRVKRDIAGLVALFLAVFVLLALLSFQRGTGARNWTGPGGAWLARQFLELLGLSSFLVVSALFSLGLGVIRGFREGRLMLVALWHVTTLFSASVLLETLFSTLPFGGAPVAAGGWLGLHAGRWLSGSLNTGGTMLLCVCLILVVTILSTPLSAEMILRGVRRALVALGRGSLSLLQWGLGHLRQEIKHNEASAEKYAQAEGEGTEKRIEIGLLPKAPGAQAALAAFDAEVDEEAASLRNPKSYGDEDREDSYAGEQEELFIDAPAAPLEAVVASDLKPSKGSRTSVSGLAGDWKLPALDLLKMPSAQERQLDREKLVENSKNLEMKLGEFGIKGQVVAVRPGPVITMYEFKPGPGVKISQIASRADDLSLALEAQSVRIVAPIPGKSVVGIELPNDDRETVVLREILASAEFQGGNQQIPIVVGKDIAGAPVVTDIASTPHLLVAGSSGAGKSVFINSLITSLLYKFTPQDLRLIMVDPKQLELALYERIPHLLLPVVDDPHKASTALRWAVNEMERRYTLMARAGVRNLKGFNQKLVAEGQEKMRSLLCPVKDDGTPGATNVSHLLEHDEKGMPVVESLPFILVIIDEFADLMMVARKDIENHVSRLAAKARASGIHLIIATQRPSTDVVTGVIKNNLPCRVGFKVPSQIDSRTILDGVGAEKLLGRGDMLFIPPGISRLVRVHGAYVDEEEIAKLCDFWRAQGEPDYREEILAEPDEVGGEEGDEGVSDPLYQQAVQLVREEGSASASRLQRRLKVGYNRAARMIESMEAQGLVGPGSGSKPREVIY